ncbi:MAG TPA: hypothetical protein PLF81_26035, partial [Candidatus Anammoximicrobium sp.]|nr:hypothetical protein [Candidatus Anammoximicrobium sp.]
MAPLMRIWLIISVVGFTVLFIWLARRRRIQLGLASLAAGQQSVELAGLLNADARSPSAAIAA